MDHSPDFVALDCSGPREPVACVFRRGVRHAVREPAIVFAVVAELGLEFQEARLVSWSENAIAVFAVGVSDTYARFVQQMVEQVETDLYDTVSTAPLSDELVQNPGPVGDNVSIGVISPRYVALYAEAMQRGWTAERRSRALAMVERKDKAAAVMEAALARDPANPYLQFVLGDLYLQLGRNREAVRYLEAVAKIESEQHSVHNTLGIALMSEEVNRTEDACFHFREACRLAPNDFGMWFNLSTTCLAINDLPGALQAAKRARKLVPDSPHVFAILAVCAHRQGKPRHATKYLKKVEALLARDPTFPMITINNLIREVVGHSTAN